MPEMEGTELLTLYSTVKTTNVRCEVNPQSWT